MTQPHSHFLVSQIIILTLFKEIVRTSAHLFFIVLHYCTWYISVVWLSRIRWVTFLNTYFFSPDFFISLRSSWNSLNKIAIVIREPYNPRKRTGCFTYILNGTTQECDHPSSSSPPEQDELITEICSFFHLLCLNTQCTYVSWRTQNCFLSFGSLRIWASAPLILHFVGESHTSIFPWALFVWIEKMGIQPAEGFDTIQSNSQSRWSYKSSSWMIKLCIPSYPLSVQLKQRPFAFFSCSSEICPNSDIKTVVARVQHKPSYLSQYLCISCWVMKMSSKFNKLP